MESQDNKTKATLLDPIGHESKNRTYTFRVIQILKDKDAESYQRLVSRSLQLHVFTFPDAGFLSKLTAPGVLVECDPSIKSIIVKIDAGDHAFIVEELDDQTLVIKENMLPILKQKLDDVRSFIMF